MAGKLTEVGRRRSENALKRGLTTLIGLAVALMLVGSLVGSPAASPAAIPGGNLVRNPGADSKPGAADSATIVAPAIWTTTGTFTAVRYGGPGGFPAATVAARIGGGPNFMAGGNAAVSTAEQTIDVAGSATEIDAGDVKARLSAFLGGYSTQPDAAMVDVQFLSAASAPLGQLRVGPVTPAQRNSATTLIQRSTEGAVPATTRQLRVVITATRGSGGYNDGYADNVAIELMPASAPAPKPKLSLRCAGRVLVATVTPSTGQTIARVTFTVKGGNRSQQIVDTKPPFSTRFPTAGLPKRLTVTATVRLASSAVVLKASATRC